MPTGVTSPANYPLLSTVMDLVRVFLNDWQRGLTGTPGEGQISTNNPAASPQTLPALNSAIREVYRELRNVGSPTLIKDNILCALPVVSPFVNPPNPGVQVQLSPNGFWDGWQLQNSVALPADLLQPLEVWEQQTGSNLPFIVMQQAQFGISSMNQGFAMRIYEWRGDALWFPGAIVPITVRLRYIARFPQFFGNELVFETTQIPIFDCEEAVAYKTAYKIGSAISGANPNTADLKANAEAAMMELRLAQVRRAQTIDYDRESYTPGGHNHEGGGYNSSR